MALNIEYWPEEVIALNAELATGLHQDLEKKLAEEIGPNYGHPDLFLERLGTIAAYCDVAIDGDFTSDHIIKICGILAGRLETRRKRRDDGKPEVIFPL